MRMQPSTYKQVDENIDASMYYVTDDLGVKRGVWITRVGAGDLEVWFGMVWYGMSWHHTHHFIGDDPVAVRRRPGRSVEYLENASIVICTK